MISQTNRTPYVQSLYRSKQNQRKPETILTSFVFDSRKFLFQTRRLFIKTRRLFAKSRRV